MNSLVTAIKNTLAQMGSIKVRLKNEILLPINDNNILFTSTYNGCKQV